MGYFIWRGGAWQRLDASSGTLETGEAVQFLYNAGGALRVAPRRRVLRALQELEELPRGAAPTGALRRGPPLPSRLVRRPRRRRSMVAGPSCCCRANTHSCCQLQHAALQTEQQQNNHLQTEQQNKQLQTEQPKKQLQTEQKNKQLENSSDTSSEKTPCKELMLDYGDVKSINRYLEKNPQVFGSIDSVRFHEDEAYRNFVLFRFQPLVQIEKLKSIEKYTKKDFVANLGLKHIDDAKSVTKPYKTRNNHHTNFSKFFRGSNKENDVGDAMGESETDSESEASSSNAGNGRHVRQSEIDNLLNEPKHLRSNTSVVQISPTRVRERDGNRAEARPSRKRKRDDNSGDMTAETERASSSVRERERASSSVRETERASSSVRERERASSSVRETERASSSVRERERASSSVRETERASSSVRERERANSSVRETERASSSVRERERASSSVRETERASSSVRERERASSSVRETERASSSVRERERANSSVRETERASSSVRERDGTKKSSRFFTKKDRSRRVAKPVSFKSGSGREYSSLEDHAIVAWVHNGRRSRQVNGNRMWRELQQAYTNITGHCRSWQSLRNRYLRHILPALPTLRLASGVQESLRANAALGEIKLSRKKSMTRRNSIFKDNKVASAWSRQPRTQGLLVASTSSPANNTRRHSTTKEDEIERISRARAKPPRTRPNETEHSSELDEFEPKPTRPNIAERTNNDIKTLAQRIMRPSRGAKTVASQDINVTNRNKSVSSRENVTSGAQNMFIRDRSVSNRDKSMSNRDKSMSNRDNVSSQDKNVANQDRRLSSEDENVSSPDRSVSNRHNISKQDNQLTNLRNKLSNVTPKVSSTKNVQENTKSVIKTRTSVSNTTEGVTNLGSPNRSPRTISQLASPPGSVKLFNALNLRSPRTLGANVYGSPNKSAPASHKPRLSADKHMAKVNVVSKRALYNHRAIIL